MSADQRRRPRSSVPGERAVLGIAQQLAHSTPVAALDDTRWIAIFRETHRLLSHLYAEKSHIEILRYLAHVELNLVLAGYTVPCQAIQDQFGKLFHRLGLQPAKGRDPQKFVYLQDVFGMQQPFVLLKLGDGDGNG